MWTIYLVLFVAVAVMYSLTVMQRRLKQSSPQQRTINYIVTIGEFAAIIAALTAIFMIFCVEKSTCQYGCLGPLRMRLNHDPEIADVKRVQTIICADTVTAQQALDALNARSDSLAAQYGRQVFDKLHKDNA